MSVVDYITAVLAIPAVEEDGELRDARPGEAVLDEHFATLSERFSALNAPGDSGTSALDKLLGKFIGQPVSSDAVDFSYYEKKGLVYPALADDAPEPPPSQSAQGHRQHDARGEEDFAGLRRYNDGDSPRNVAWKAYARTGELLSKRFAGSDTSSQWLDFNELETSDVEERLSILARWVVDAERSHRDYGLRLAGHEFPPANGDAQRHRCLEALALFEGTGHVRADA